MAKCPNCGYDKNQGKFCIKCGKQIINTENREELVYNYQDNEVATQETTIEQQQVNTPDYTQQNYNNYNNQQGNYHQFGNNQQNNQIPQNQKSKAVGIILNILLVGLGYAYVGKWGEGIVLFVVYLLMWFLGFLLIFPFLIAFALWVYSLVKTNEMIDKYNAGLPY